MSEKPKKSKARISQWRFLLHWVVGQFLAYWIVLVMGRAIMPPIFNFMGLDFYSVDPIIRSIALFISSGMFAYLMAYVQQASIQQRFGNHIKHWRQISTTIFAILVPIVAIAGQWFWDTFEAYRQTPFMEILFQISPFVLIWGILGIAQAWLLRKRVKHAWLFALSTIISGILLGTASNLSSIFSQLLIHSVTGFTLIWLFYMSRNPEVMQSEDEAIERLSDSTDEAEFEPDEEEQAKKKYSNLWEWLRYGLRFGFNI